MIQLKRNINRFPTDFYFQLTDEEKEKLLFQSGTANNMSRLNPFIFTEQGVAMLSSVLHTEIAVEISIRIIRSFVKMRHYINYNKSFLPHRCILLDIKKLYSCGASFKDFGKKCFAISEFDYKEYLTRLLMILNL